MKINETFIKINIIGWTIRLVWYVEHVVAIVDHLPGGGGDGTIGNNSKFWFPFAPIKNRLRGRALIYNFNSTSSVYALRPP